MARLVVLVQHLDSGKSGARERLGTPDSAKAPVLPPHECQIHNFTACLTTAFSLRAMAYRPTVANSTKASHFLVSGQARLCLSESERILLEYHRDGSDLRARVNDFVPFISRTLPPSSVTEVLNINLGERERIPSGATVLEDP